MVNANLMWSASRLATESACARLGAGRGGSAPDGGVDHQRLALSAVVVGASGHRDAGHPDSVIQHVLTRSRCTVAVIR